MDYMMKSTVWTAALIAIVMTISAVSCGVALVNDKSSGSDVELGEESTVIAASDNIPADYSGRIISLTYYVDGKKHVIENTGIPLIVSVETHKKVIFSTKARFEGPTNSRAYLYFTGDDVKQFKIVKPGRKTVFTPNYYFVLPTVGSRAYQFQLEYEGVVISTLDFHVYT